MIVVNLFAQPGAGKSTGAAFIFSVLKMANKNVELVREFAKDKVWEKNDSALSNQLYMLGKQCHYLSRCMPYVDAVITDSPILLSVMYNKDKTLGDSFKETVVNKFKSMDNMNYLLKRVKPYNPIGRLQTEKESDKLADTVKHLLDDNGVEYTCVNGDMEGYMSIVNDVLKRLRDIEAYNTKASDCETATTDSEK